MDRKHTIIYITYVDIMNTFSGSHVRPLKMLKAFEREGYTILSLSGDQTDSNRGRQVRNLLDEIKLNTIDFCYIESPTYPIMRHCDRSLIKSIHDKGIPIGYFYRDFYRKFPLQTDKRSLSRRIKDKALDYLQWRTDQVLHNCDIIYLPSEECKTLFNFKNMKVLPPAGDNFIPIYEKEINYTCIYVGGILGHYDGKLLLDAFGELYKRDNRYKLILVCRQKEWEKFTHPFKHECWLEVHHTSGEGLIELYNKAMVALVVHNNNTYNQYAIPVKTFEYMSYGLPIVSVNIQALAKFIKTEDIGVVVDSTPSAVANGVEVVTQNKDSYYTYVSNVKYALINRNLWEHRVKTVSRELLSLRNANDK